MSFKGRTVYIFVISILLIHITTGSQLAESTSRSTWRNAYKSCPSGKLGNPAELQISDTAWQNLKLNETMWIAGIQKRSEFYWWLGCYASVTIQTSHEFSDGLSFQRCAEFCGNKTEYLALQKNNCSCATTVIGVNNGRCNLRCSGSSKDLCGGDNYYTVHKKWKTDETRILDEVKNAEVTDFNCVSVGNYPEGPDVSKLGWVFENCSNTLETLCQVNKTYIQEVDGQRNWLDSKNNCSSRNQTLQIFTITDQRRIQALDILVESRPYWSGLHRSVENVYTQDFQTPPPDRCLAVMRNGGNKVVEHPRKCTENLRSICLIPDESAGSGDSETQQKETKSDDNLTVNEGLNNTSNTAAIAGGIIGGILVLLLIAILVICVKRQSKAKTEKKTTYCNPHVSNSPPDEQNRESEIVLEDEPSLEKTNNRKKPVRRMKSKKEYNEGVSYENVVLTLEDPHVLSKVLSPTSNETYKSDDNDYDTSQSVRSKVFNNTENIYNTNESEYDVMERCKPSLESSGIYDVMANCKPTGIYDKMENCKPSDHRGNQVYDEVKTGKTSL